MLNGVRVKDHNGDIRTYDLHVSNWENEGRLTLTFVEGKRNDFTIQIIEGQVHLRRLHTRPAHDHDDEEFLVCLTDKQPSVYWSSRFPYSGEGKDFVPIPFGAHRGNY